ncbi:hypothetical protein BH11MYX2_BH11MYX2_29910 [soil metagenome]
MQKIIALASILSIGACVAGTEDSTNLSSTDQHVTASNRIAFNRIAFNRIAFNRIAFNGLTQVTSGDGSLLDSADGRDLLAYTTGCALPAGQDLALTAADGVTYHFSGLLGLAPNWNTAPATDSEKRWVSACLLSRCNAFGISVQFSMRGDNSALSVDSAEAAAFGLREASFWGDLFDGSVEAHACAGPLKLANSQQSTMPLRECSVSDPADPTHTKCGMSYAGACADVCTDANGIYTGCGGATQVVTTYLAN